MAKAALFVGWGPLIPGREKAAQAVFQGAMQYLVSLQKDGTIDGFETVALEPHGGDLIGFVLIKGDREKIARLRTSEELTRIAVRVQMVHTGVAFLGAYTGDEMQSLFSIWDQEGEELLS